MYSFFFLLLLFFNAFPPKITLGPWHGVGEGGVHLWAWPQGQKSDVQWAKKWRKVGQNVTYVGLKSDIRAKMQHWSVIIMYEVHLVYDLCSGVWFMLCCSLYVFIQTIFIYLLGELAVIMYCE